MTLQRVPGFADPRAEGLRGLCGGAVHLQGTRRTTWRARPGTCRWRTTRPPSPTRRSRTRWLTCSGRPRQPGCASPPKAPDTERLRSRGGCGRGPAPYVGDDRSAIDVERGLVRAGAGVLWGDLAEAAGRDGLAGRHPSSPDVGVVGYSLGGGIGWYARRLGLQCNAVTSVDLVLADGSVVRASAESEAELFWALRGGGAPFGVVTALEFELFPLDTVVAGFLAWDWTAVERVLPAWVAWCAAAPEEATTSFRLVQVPDGPVRASCVAADLPSSTGLSSATTRRPRSCWPRCGRWPRVRHGRPRPGRLAGAVAPRARGAHARLREQHAHLGAARRRHHRRHRGRRSRSGTASPYRAAPARRCTGPSRPARRGAVLA